MHLTHHAAANFGRKSGQHATNNSPWFAQPTFVMQTDHFYYVWRGKGEDDDDSIVPPMYLFHNNRNRRRFASGSAGGTVGGTTLGQP